MAARVPKFFRERFIASAWKLGCAGGYEAVKIRAIAEDVGVSGALIYSYFDDKASLMDELRRIGYQELDNALMEAVAGAEPRTALLRLSRCYVDRMRRLAWLYSGDSKLELHGPSSDHAQAFLRYAADFLGRLTMGVDEPPATVALHLWLALRGVLGTSIADLTFDPPFTQRHVDLMVAGVCAAVPLRVVDEQDQPAMLQGEG